MSLYKPMRDPSKHALHLPWVQETRAAIEGRDLGAPVRDGHRRPICPVTCTPTSPTSSLPPPATPFPEFEEELETGGLARRSTPLRWSSST